jgi:hypothetical protein
MRPTHRHNTRLPAGTLIPALARLGCLPVILAVCLCVTARAQTDPPAITSSNRFLFVFDSSPAVHKQVEDERKALREIMASRASGQLHYGDSIGVWSFDSELHTGYFPLQLWLPTQEDEVTLRMIEFLRQVPAGGKSRLGVAMDGISQIVANSDIMAVFIFSTGDTPIEGTPFDDAINSLYQQALADMGSKRMPIVTVLVARHGRFIRYSVNALPWPVVIPELPVEIAGMKTEITARSPAPAAVAAPAAIVPAPAPTPALVAAATAPATPPSQPTPAPVAASAPPPPMFLPPAPAPAGRPAPPAPPPPAPFRPTLAMTRPVTPTPAAAPPSAPPRPLPSAPPPQPFVARTAPTPPTAVVARPMAPPPPTALVAQPAPPVATPAPAPALAATPRAIPPPAAPAAPSTPAHATNNLPAESATAIAPWGVTGPNTLLVAGCALLAMAGALVLLIMRRSRTAHGSSLITKSINLNKR